MSVIAIDWDVIAKKVIHSTKFGTYDTHKKRLMDSKVISGQYSTVHLNMYNITGIDYPSSQ